MPQEVSGQAEITVEPSEIRAGMFFDGAAVRVMALVPDSMEVTMSLVGRDEPVAMNRKGKVLGLIWMNTGEVEIDGAPDLYLLHTSGDLQELADPPVLAAMGVGYAAVEAGTKLEGTGGDDHLYFQEFVSLKEGDGLYAVAEGAVQRTAEDGGRTLMSTELGLPPKTPPGSYRLLIHGFQEGRGILLGTLSLSVQQVGMAEAIQILASDHGLLYGVLAVVVAIVVGLLTGVLFGLGSKKAH
jgi:uncharacterized protein (TIGR02186 family)